MKTFGSIVLMVFSVLSFLAVIAAMQYGYHNGPAWLYRDANGTPALFPIVTGFAGLIGAIAGCLFGAYCMTESKP